MAVSVTTIALAQQMPMPNGGELVIEEQFGAQAVKLPAGHMLLYPSSSLHRVAPVTRGRRVAPLQVVEHEHQRGI